MKIKLERLEKESRYHTDVHRALIERNGTTYEVSEDRHGSGLKVRIVDGWSSQLIVQPEAANTISVRSAVDS